MVMQRCLAALVLLPALLMPLQGRAAPLYNVAFLPVGDFAPAALNNAGQIAGTVYAPDGTDRVVLYSGGVMHDLGLAGNGASYASALNDAGAVTGRTLIDNIAHGFLYQNGNLIDLGANTSGWGINASGDVVGARYTDAGTFGFVYSGGSFQQLPNLGPSRLGVAVDINDHGDIAGFSYTNYDSSPPPLHVYRYRNGELIDLGGLGDSNENIPTGINNAGQIAGASRTGDDDHAFLYEDGVFKDLGSFGGRNLGVVDFNEHGTLVGNASLAGGGAVAFMNIGDSLVDLNTLIDPALGWNVFFTYANNDLGQIIGWGCQGDTCGVVQLDVANAVPEPGAGLLLLPGLAVLFITKRRRQRQA